MNISRILIKRSWISHLDAFKQEEELMYNGNSLLCEAWKQLHIETLFYETFLLTSHTGAIYFTIQNEYIALGKKKDMKSLTSSFQMS